MQASHLQFCLQLARGIAQQFGSNCEVVVHDLDSNDVEHSIVAIENGHVSGRRWETAPPISCWRLCAATVPAWRTDWLI